MSRASSCLRRGAMRYIGMGIQPPAPEWGEYALGGHEGGHRAAHPGPGDVPGVAIVITALCFNLVGDGLADAIDPRRRQ